MPIVEVMVAIIGFLVLGRKDKAIVVVGCGRQDLVGRVQCCCCSAAVRRRAATFGKSSGARQNLG